VLAVACALFITACVVGMTPDQPSLRAVLESRGYARTPLLRMNSGYLSARVRVNGKWLNLILDTGSPKTCLDQERTNHLGLTWRSITKLGRTEGKEGREAKIGNAPSSVAAINSFELGPTHLDVKRVYDHDVTNANRILAHWGDLPIDGLIGADMLEHTHAIIDYDNFNLFVTTTTSGR
jgi:Aspartyl protease